jgi:hypothetical protein
MEKHVWLFFMRAAQLVGLSIAASGLRQLGPLVTGMGQAVNGELDAAELSQRLIAVTGRLLAGLLFIWLLEYFIRRERQLREGLLKHSHDPWMINPAWSSGRIQLSNRRSVVGLAVASTVYLLLAVPLSISSPDRITRWLVVLAGLALCTVAQTCRSRRRWNRAELRLGTLPGVLGGPFTGVVVLQEGFPTDTVFEVTLKCVAGTKRTDSATYSMDSTEGKAVWSSAVKIDKTLTSDQPDRTAIPVSFAVPFDCLPTTIETPVGERTIRWKLSVDVKSPGRYGGCVFEVPVFKTAASNKTFRPDESSIARYYQQVDPAPALARRQTIRIQHVDGSQRWGFSTYESSALVFFLGMTAVSAAVLTASLHWLRPWPITVFVGVFSGLFTGIGLYHLFEILTWSATIVARPDELTATCGLPGWRRSVTMPRDKRTQLKCRLDFRRANGETWCIDLQPPPRVIEVVGGVEQERYATAEEIASDPDDLDIFELRPLLIVKRLNGQQEADAVRKTLADDLGIA